MMNALTRNLLPRTLSKGKQQNPVRRLKYVVMAALAMYIFFMGSIRLATWGDYPCNGGDSHWFDFSSVSWLKKRPDEYPYKSSKYLMMRDGVEIAIDIYLPKNIAKQHQNHLDNTQDANGTATLETPQKVPTFVHLTRYSRSVDVRFPFNLFSLNNEAPDASWNFWTWHFAQPLLAAEYAFISVDARGTGASFGSRGVDMSPEEIEDYRQVIEWVRSQPWSDQKIATGGLSYDGMVGLQVASQGYADAVFALFSPGDVFTDVASPGGVLNTAFVYSYETFTSAIEKMGALWSGLYQDSMVPLLVTVGIQALIARTSGVEGRESDVIHALAEHQANWNMTQLAREQNLMQHSDDVVVTKDGRSFSVGLFGATSETMESLHQARIPVYSVGGYYDSGSVRGAVRLHNYLTSRSKSDGVVPLSRLILGPWGHGARRTMNPFGSGSLACFEPEMHLDFVRVLDCELKNICWGSLKDEKPVHFLMQERMEDAEYFATLPDLVSSIPASSTFSSCPNSENNHQQMVIGGMESELKSKDIAVVRKKSREPSWPWKSSYVFPPRTVEYQTLFMTNEGRELNKYHLSSQPQSSSLYGSKVQYNLEMSADYTIGGFNRWNLVHHCIRYPITHGDREAARHATKNSSALVFESPKLEKPMRMVGSVWVSMEIELEDGIDAPLFFYLEATLPNGSTYLVSETQLMVSHSVTSVRGVKNASEYVQKSLDRAVDNLVAQVPTREALVIMSKNPSSIVTHGSHDIIERSFTSAARLPVTSRIPLDVTLESSVFTFPTGSTIRLTVSGADKENFLVRPFENLHLASGINIFVDDAKSMMHIPVMNHDYDDDEF